MKALLNLFVESAANDQATHSEWNNMSDVNRTATSEQSWRRKEPTPRRKQSTQAKQLTARNKNALACVTQENKITPNRTTVFMVNVSRVHANSIPQKIGKKQNERTRTLHFWKLSEWYTNKWIKKCLRNTNILNDLPSFHNSSILVVKYQIFTKFSIRWPVSR